MLKIYSSKYIEEIPFDEISEVNANVSLSAESAYILWDFRRKFYSQKDNIFLPESNKLLNDLQDIEKTQKIPVHKFAIKKAIANLVDRNNLEDIHWLQEKYGLSLGVPNHVIQQDSSEFESDNLYDYLDTIDFDSIYKIMQYIIVRHY